MSTPGKRSRCLSGRGPGDAFRDEWREPWKARGARPIASVERPDRMEGLAIAESKPTYCGLREEAP